jgi:hypothetical protein
MASISDPVMPSASPDSHHRAHAAASHTIRGEKAKGQTPGGNHRTYMDDPARYVIQYIIERM